MKHCYLKHLFTALLLLCTTVASAHDFELGGIYYNILSAVDKTVEVTYKGTSYSEYSNEYTGSVVIPESVTYNGNTYSVTSIGNNAFQGCTGLTSAQIPNSVTTIESYAFYICRGLTSIEIPNSVTIIESYAFASCTFLKSIKIPDSVTSLGYGVFSDCKGLTSIEIPNSVTSIGSYMFFGCTSLTSFEIPNTLTSTVPEMFANCSNLVSVTIPNSITRIEHSTFSWCSSLASVEIPSSVTFIGERAFHGCESLSSITSLIPAEKLFTPKFSSSNGLDAFYGVDKTKCVLYVPYGAKETYASTEGWSEFANIVELEPETIGGSCGENVNWTLEDGVLTISGNGAMDDYTWPKSSPWTEYKSEIKTVVIEDGVTSIGGEAFVGCTELTSIEIPNSVTSIANYAFYDCTALTAVCISDLASWCNVDLGGRSNPLSNVCNLYLNGALLTELVIPEGVSKIKDWVFSNCCSLTSVTIPNSVTSIGNSAFYNCTGLTSVTIPSSVKSIESLAFGFCSNVKTITIGFGVKDYCKAFIGTYAEEVYISDLTDLCESYMNSDMGWLLDTKLFLNGELITNLIIPDGVTTISNYLFLRCTTITSVTFSESVTRIGDYAFYNCSGLTSVTIPGSVTNIGYSAFEGCRHLESVTSLIPAEDLFTISNNVFDSVNKNTCILYVPYGAKETYAATDGWNEFTNIVEIVPTDITITINQYGAATYCSPYALDFSNVEGLKAYSAIGYKPSTQVVTLARVMTTGAGQGVFIKGEPGEYTVPVIDNFDEYTLNMLVGTLKQTTVNSTDGAMSNYKFTIAEGDEAPMFYPFEDNTTFSAGKAYLQIPTAWLPATAQKSVSIRFDEGETTDIDEVKGESGEVKTIYDLQGRVVENPTSGIYIINGKKVFIK